MPIPGVHVETLYNARLYQRDEIERMIEVAGRLRRGKLVYALPPRALAQAGMTGRPCTLRLDLEDAPACPRCGREP